MRFNFLFFFVKPLIQYPAIGVVLASVAFFLEKEYVFLTVFGLNVFFALIYLPFVHFQHSHFNICFGPRWGKFFTSPKHHHLHHSISEKHRDKNFAFYFSFFDWIFGTQQLPTKEETFQFGILDSKAATENTLYACVLLPCISMPRALIVYLKRHLYFLIKRKS